MSGNKIVLNSEASNNRLNTSSNHNVSVEFSQSFSKKDSLITVETENSILHVNKNSLLSAENIVYPSKEKQESDANKQNNNTTEMIQDSVLTKDTTQNKYVDEYFDKNEIINKFLKEVSEHNN